MNKKFTLSHFRLCILLALSCFSFSVGHAQTLPGIQCQPIFGSSCAAPNGLGGSIYETITNVQFTNVNAAVSTTTTCTNTSVYNDTAKLCGGTTDTMTVTTNGDVGIAVFIDLDNDGYFTSPGEYIYSNYPSIGGIYKFPVAIPSTISSGLHYMRIMVEYQNSYGPGTDPCYTATLWGDFVDMYINVLDTTHITTQPQSLAACLKGPATLTVSAFGHALSYQWVKNGTPVNGANNPTFTIPHFDSTDTGHYNVVVTNACSIATSDTVALTIKPAPRARLFTHGPKTFCPGGSVALIGDTVGHGYTYRWLYNGAPTSDTTNRDTVSLPGTYAFVISNGCPDTSRIDTIYNYPTGVPTITPAVLTKVCAISPVTFATPAGPANKVHYQWQINTGLPNSYGNISNDTTISFPATQTGFYRLQLIDSNSCISYSLPTPLQENSPALVNINTLQSLYLCSGGFITFTASSSDTGEKYRWQYNGVPINPPVTSASYNAYRAGTYSVLGDNGCSVTSASLIVTTIPAPIVIASGPTVFCGGGSVLLNSNVTDTTLRYQWLKNDNIIPGATSPLYTALDSGSYSVVVISNNTCTAGSTAINVIVHPLPNPVISVGADNLTLTVTPYFHSYQWYIGNTLIPGAIHSSYVAHVAGLYSVAVIDDNTCTGTSAQVQAMGDVAVGTVPAPESVSIYPNPATSIVHITAPFTVNVSLTAIDGRVVINQAAAKDINIQSLADGIYMIRVADANGNTIKIEKLVKSNQ